ncbi:MAG: histidine phosphatase family protein [Frankiaceae bacterium]|nr:histidine phosphatase family protein [Frankiaceae bacterium]
MGDTTIVHLVRHGEVHNPEHVLYGRLPGYRLSTLGEQMAEQAAAALAGRDIRLARSSPLERAVQTMQPIALALGLTPTTDDRLIESVNVFEGTREAWRKPANWRHLWNPMRPSWGEPYDEVAARMLAAAADARDEVRGAEAVFVSHQLPIWVARLAAQHQRLWHRPDRRECALGSITSLVYDGDELVRVDYAEPAGSVGRRTIGGA